MRSKQFSKEKAARLPSLYKGRQTHRESQKRTAKTTLFCTIYQVAVVGNFVSADSSRLAYSLRPLQRPVISI
jgi:hypothetical protein